MIPFAAEVVESSKTAYYSVGAAFVVFALLVAVAGILRPDFPGGALRSRLLMLVTLVFAAGTLTTAIASG